MTDVMHQGWQDHVLCTAVPFPGLTFAFVTPTADQCYRSVMISSITTPSLRRSAPTTPNCLLTSSHTALMTHKDEDNVGHRTRAGTGSVFAEGNFRKLPKEAG